MGQSSGYLSVLGVYIKIWMLCNVDASSSSPARAIDIFIGLSNRTLSQKRSVKQVTTG